MTAWDEKRPVKLSQDETTALIKASDGTRFVSLKFGPSGVFLQPEPQNEWAYAHLQTLRHPVTGN